MDAVDAAKIDNNGFYFARAIEQLIEGSRFLDFYNDIVNDPNSDFTLSTLFSSNFEKGKNINTQAALEYLSNKDKNLAVGLFDSKLDTSLMFIDRYEKLIQTCETEMRQAYVQNTKFEREINHRLEDQTYYTFFEIKSNNSKENPLYELKNVLTVSSKIMDQIITNTEEFKLKVVPLIKRETLSSLDDQKYRISLGKDSNTIIDDLRQAINKNNITVNKNNFFQGLMREDESGNLQKIQFGQVQKEFETLSKAWSQNRIISSKTGEKVQINRLGEIIFDTKKIALASNEKETIKYFQDSVSSLTGLDVNFKKGGVSVKAYGATSNSIQLTTSSLVQQSKAIFGQARQDFSQNKASSALGMMVSNIVDGKLRKTKASNFDDFRDKALSFYTNGFNKATSKYGIVITRNSCDDFLSGFLEEEGIDKSYLMGSAKEQQKFFNYMEEKGKEEGTEALEYATEQYEEAWDEFTEE